MYGERSCSQHGSARVARQLVRFPASCLYRLGLGWSSQPHYSMYKVVPSAQLQNWQRSIAVGIQREEKHAAVAWSCRCALQPPPAFSTLSRFSFDFWNVVSR